jgi:hypothetical protein
MKQIPIFFFFIVSFSTSHAQNHEAISVHPNPTSGILYLNLPDNYTGHVAVRDIDGKVVYEKDINASNLTNIDLTMYSGVYFIVFKSETGDQSVHKVILIK